MTTGYTKDDVEMHREVTDMNKYQDVTDEQIKQVAKAFARSRTPSKRLQLLAKLHTMQVARNARKE